MNITRGMGDIKESNIPSRYKRNTLTAISLEKISNRLRTIKEKAIELEEKAIEVTQKGKI